jgi:hypothetical protein
MLKVISSNQISFLIILVYFLIYFVIYKFHLTVSIEIVIFFFFDSFFVKISLKNVSILLEDD